jgi:hypothetical protein
VPVIGQVPGTGTGGTGQHVTPWAADGDLQLASEPDITDPVTVRGHGFPIRSQCQWQTGKQPLAVTVKVSRRSEFKFFAAAALRLVATDRDSRLTALSHDRDSSQCGPAGAAGRRVSLSIWTTSPPLQARDARGQKN